MRTEYVLAARAAGRRPFAIGRAARAAERRQPGHRAGVGVVRHRRAGRGGAVVPRLRHPAADPVVGPDAAGEPGAAVHRAAAGASSPASRSPSPCSGSTCSATGCATSSTRGWRTADERRCRWTTARRRADAACIDGPRPDASRSATPTSWTTCRSAIGRGERVGLIGESGLGQVADRAVAHGAAARGRRGVRLGAAGRASDHDLVGAGERRLSRVRGRDVAMVFQEPMTALNPTMRVGDQVAEAMLIHGTVPGPAQRRAPRAVELLGPGRAARARRRRPAPTRTSCPAASASGWCWPSPWPTTRRCWSATSRPPRSTSPCRRWCSTSSCAASTARDAALLFITHDLAVVATVCERVLVMYGGRVVEAGPVARGVPPAAAPLHPGPARAPPTSTDVDERGPAAPRSPAPCPPPGEFPTGCVFRNRCPHATDDVRARARPGPGPDAGQRLSPATTRPTRRPAAGRPARSVPPWLTGRSRSASAT